MDLALLSALLYTLSCVCALHDIGSTISGGILAFGLYPSFQKHAGIQVEGSL